MTMVRKGAFGEYYLVGDSRVTFKQIDELALAVMYFDLSANDRFHFLRELIAERFWDFSIHYEVIALVNNRIFELRKESKEAHS